MDPVQCPQCGSPNESEDNFCSVCGQPLNPRHAESTATHPALNLEDDGVPMLLVTRGPSAGSRFALNPTVTTIGRHPDSDIFLDDVTVSRRHSEVRRDGDTFTISDSGSLNGTYVDSQRISIQRLVEGAQVQIGKFRLVFVFGGAHGHD